MRFRLYRSSHWFICFFLIFAVPRLWAQVPTPASVLGHTPGDDFYLANYNDAIRYFHALAASSDKIKMFTVGKATSGQDIEIAVISSAENLAKLDQYKADSRRLATADGLDDASAGELAHNTKIIVHIDGGLHSSEVAGGQHSIMLAYKLLSAKNDPQIDAILNNVILVLWPTLNPDGQNLVVAWYRKNLGTPYEVSPMPWLYQAYVGHDNNRDGFMMNMKETQVIMKTQLDYEPVIFYCQHQTAPFPARIWIPPFSNPISSNISPYVRSWLNVVGTNMVAYLDEHHLPGAVSESEYDNWYAGFTDWMLVFRNGISFFTETALYRYATPHFYTVRDFPKDTQELRAGSMYTTPWVGGWWRLRDAVNYMVASSMSVLDLAAKNRETLLYNRYQSARDNVQRKDPPFAYVISDRQRDVPEAGLLAQKMIENGLDVYQTKSGFHVNGVDYPEGSWVIPMDQPFSPVAKELLERQTYPAAAVRQTAAGSHLPYDVTGWTLSLQMGVSVDEVTDPIPPEQRALLTRIDHVTLPSVDVSEAGGVFAVSHKPNASFQIVNAVLSQGGSVAMATEPVKTAEGTETGAFILSGISRSGLSGLADKYGVGATALPSAPAKSIELHKAKIGLYRPWEPSIDEGWTRWILENYNFQPHSIYNADMRSAGLRSRYDIIILPDMSSDQLMNGFHPGVVPGRYAGGIGRDGLYNLREFVRNGGTLIAFNRTAASLIPVMSLPVKNVLEGLKSDKFFCSGALLRVNTERSDLPANYGLPDAPVVMFQRGPAFDTLPGFHGAVLAKYATQTNPLESGLLLHPEAIQGKDAALELAYGQGRIVLLGFKPQERAQSHGTYKYFFNMLYSYEHPPLPTQGAAPTVLVASSKTSSSTPAIQAKGGHRAHPMSQDR